MAAAPSLETAAVAADPTRERSRWSSLFSGSGGGIKRIGGRKSKKAREGQSADEEEAAQAPEDQAAPNIDERALTPPESTSSRRGSKQEEKGLAEARRGSDQDQDEITPATNERTTAAADGEDDGDQDAVEAIHFYRRDQPYFWLSNSSDHAVYLDGVRYPTAGR